MDRSCFCEGLVGEAGAMALYEDELDMSMVRALLAAGPNHLGTAQPLPVACSDTFPPLLHTQVSAILFYLIFFTIPFITDMSITPEMSQICSLFIKILYTYYINIYRYYYVIVRTLRGRCTRVVSVGTRLFAEEVCVWLHILVAEGRK